MYDCYKICRVVDGKYFSLHGRYFPLFDTEYVVDKYVFAPVGKLFVYMEPRFPVKILEDDGRKDLVLLQCRAEDIAYITHPLAVPDIFEVDNYFVRFNEYWKTGKVVNCVALRGVGLTSSLYVRKVFSSEEIEALRRILV